MRSPAISHVSSYAVFLFFTGVAFLAGTGPARAEPNPRVVLAVDGIKEARNLPAILAERLGYFKDEGLLVTLMEIRDDIPTNELLMDGRIDGAVAFYHHTILAYAEGRSTEAVITMGGSPGLKLMVASRLKDQVHTIADLKGHAIFTGGPNSGKTTAANWAMIHAGLTPADFKALQPTTRDAMAESLGSGAADAIVAHEPDASYYLAHGTATVLANLTSVAQTRQNLGSVFPSTALYLSTAYVKAHPSVVQHLVNAFARAVRYINSHPAEEILAQLPKEIVGKRSAEYLNNLREDMQMFATDGLLDPVAASAECRAMGNYTKKFTKVKIAETFTNEFVLAATGAPR